ncbi:phosphoenolpyruvate--protein phosphotransferase [Dialister succinatiphilus]|mgnify:FL=1|uniref:phosphoenolpyruvate--protein phosphotransferase n=1 Tax=Dialister succinatiphilus TaxID=487173 RepID=UPI0023566AD7|nr:phosphoenolpyruvate--protein phosphotransferase [Dialister succinatiphilus]MCI6030563.1 phosphoenolpyruvate--protein phosphotransferase [Dialister succinatiphilus]
MEKITGKSISGMVTIGPLRVFRHKEFSVEESKVDRPETEVARFDSARNTASAKMNQFYQEAVSHVGLDNASIFKVYQQMLTESEFVDAVRSMIRSQSINAESAISQAEKNFTQIYSSGTDVYMQAHVADVQEIARILLRTLHQKKAMFAGDEPCILYADDLTPSETIQMDTKKILGFVTKEGTPTSHTAILARALGVPAIVATGTEVDDSFDGKTAVIDGFSGTVYLDPTPGILAVMKEKQDQSIRLKELLQQLKGLPSETVDGHRVEVAANVSSASDLAAVLKNDAEGIGLFRSEFIYMGRDTLPSEEEQFNIYKLAIETMAGKRVIIRTLDIGADKEASAFHLPKEENPALGMRAIRICLKRPEIFKTQLRAILRASAFGKAAIMFPLITSVWEVWKAREILDEVRMELDKKGIAYDHHMEVGIMIETPAAALISDKLAKEVDFFSIGTNDLSQYTLVVDRTSRVLSDFFNPHHPAVLKLIQMTVENAHKAGIWVGMCGELGSDLSITETFLRMGVDEFSVAPYSVLPLRKQIRSIDLSK